MKYIGIVFKDEHSDYGIVFPDFPGCVSAGSTLDEVRGMGAEALIGHIALMKEKGETLPLPSSLDDIMDTPEFHRGLAFYVDVPSQKTIRCNVTFQDDVLALIDQMAEEEHLSRSSFLAEAALTYKRYRNLEDYQYEGKFSRRVTGRDQNEASPCPMGRNPRTGKKVTVKKKSPKTIDDKKHSA